MLLQIEQQIVPVVGSCFVEQTTMGAVNSKPDFFATKQRTHAREWKSEVAQRLAVTRMHDVDCLGRFSNDREAKLARSGSRHGWKTRQLLAPQIVFVTERHFRQ